MMRYEITFDKVGRIFDPQGMVERIVIRTDTDHAKIAVYIDDKNTKKFEKLLERHAHVIQYDAHEVSK